MEKQTDKERGKESRLCLLSIRSQYAMSGDSISSVLLADGAERTPIRFTSE